MPDGLTFADLALEREAITGRLLFRPTPPAAVCRLNDMDPAATLADEDLSCWLSEMGAVWQMPHSSSDGPRADRAGIFNCAECACCDETTLPGAEAILRFHAANRW